MKTLNVQPVTFDNVIIGHQSKLGSAIIFFGNKNSSTENIEPVYKLKLNFLKQVHGDKVVRTQNLVEADAHWTDDQTALAVFTADCLPVLVHCRSTSRVLAAHTGWRGVRSEIVKKSLKQLITSGSDSSSLVMAIGPHIQKQSFEIEEDLAMQMIPDKKAFASYCSPAASEGKVLVSLKSIVKDQALSLGLVHSNIYELNIDTFTDPLYHSYRREKGKGRLISFIQLN